MAKKILLADDSITIQKVVELTFSDGDYEVVATNNGNKAIQRLAEWKPDIILSDIIMPEKNGYELCEYVKSHPDFRNIPVILLTGTFEPFDPDRAEKAGCDAVITKPFESQSLIHKVEELISGAAGSSGTSKTQPVPAVSHTQDNDDGGALSGMEDSQTKAWPVPKLDMGWSAPKPDAPPQPAKSKSPAKSEEPAPKSSTVPKEEPRAAAASKPASPFDDGDDLSAGSGMSSSSAFDDEAMKAPSTPEAQFDFSGATKAFPKMKFEELPGASGSSSGPRTPEPPAKSSWSSAPAKASEPDWDSPSFNASPPPSMKTEESPFGDELSEPESSQSESIFSSSPSPSGFGSSPSPAGFGSSSSPAGFGSLPSPSGFGSSPSPSSSGSSSPSPAGFASPTSPSGFGSSPSPTKTPEVAVSSSSKSETAPAGKSDLSEEQIDKIARRVVELMSEQVVRNIAWEVIPDLAEMVVRERIRQLESEN